MVTEELVGVDCIYTNQKLYKAGFSVEHFIAYAFVSHDLLWNLFRPARYLIVPNRTSSRAWKNTLMLFR